MSFEQKEIITFVLIYALLFISAWSFLDVLPVVYTDHGWDYIKSRITQGVIAFLSSFIVLGMAILLGVWLS